MNAPEVGSEWYATNGQDRERIRVTKVDEQSVWYRILSEDGLQGEIPTSLADWNEGVETGRLEEVCDGS